MKKKTNYLTIGAVLLALIVIVIVGMQFALITSNCTMEGYANCWYDGQSSSYGQAYAKATPTLGFNSWLDSTKYYKQSKFTWIYIDSLRVGYNCIGDKAYYTTTGYSECDKNGCSGIEIPTSGYINLASYKQQLVDVKTTLYIQCWDYDYDYDDGDWAYAWGWAGAAYPVEALGIRIAQCYDDIDCGTNMYCNHNGAYTEWHCTDTPVIDVPIVNVTPPVIDPIIIDDPIINVTPINDTPPEIYYPDPIINDTTPIIENETCVECVRPASIWENIVFKFSKFMDWFKNIFGGN